MYSRLNDRKEPGFGCSMWKFFDLLRTLLFRIIITHIVICFEWRSWWIYHGYFFVSFSKKTRVLLEWIIQVLLIVVYRRWRFAIV